MHTLYIMHMPPPQHHNSKHVPRIAEVSSLASVLEHAMYCGMSLGRMGLDFRALLPPIFDAAVLTIVDRV